MGRVSEVYLIFGAELVDWNVFLSSLTRGEKSHLSTNPRLIIITDGYQGQLLILVLVYIILSNL